MAIIKGIFCLNVLILSCVALPANKDGFVKSSVELSALSNGTTKTITVAANQKVTLDCFVQDYRHNKVGWFLDTMQLETEDQESAYASLSSYSFEAQELQGTDKIYTCQTENFEEKFWTRVKIIVEDKIDIEKFYVEISERSSSQSWELDVPLTKNAAELNCFYQDVNPSKVGWYENNQLLPTDNLKEDYAFLSKLKIPIEMLSSSCRKFTCKSEELENVLFAVVKVCKDGKPEEDETADKPEKDEVFPELNNPELETFTASILVLIIVILAIMFFSFFILLIYFCVNSSGKVQPSVRSRASSKSTQIIKKCRRGPIDSSPAPVHVSASKSSKPSQYLRNITQSTIISCKRDYEPIDNN